MCGLMLVPQSTCVFGSFCLLHAEGTFGVVHRARCKSTGAIYALKKLKLEQCPDGFPQTSVREMNVLLSLNHPKIVNVAEVRGSNPADGNLSDGIEQKKQ
jgi:serine/threonine protein kinase